MTTYTNRVVHELRLSGEAGVCAVIWAHDAEKRTSYGVTLSSMYKLGEDWRPSDMLDERDLLVAAKTLDLADSYIRESLRSGQWTEPPDDPERRPWYYCPGCDEYFRPSLANLFHKFFRRLWRRRAP